MLCALTFFAAVAGLLVLFFRSLCCPSFALSLPVVMRFFLRDDLCSLSSDESTVDSSSVQSFDSSCFSYSCDEDSSLEGTCFIGVDYVSSDESCFSGDSVLSYSSCESCSSLEGEGFVAVDYVSSDGEEDDSVDESLSGECLIPSIVLVAPRPPLRRSTRTRRKPVRFADEYDRYYL